MSARSAGAVFAALGEDTRLALVARLSARGPRRHSRVPRNRGNAGSASRTAAISMRALSVIAGSRGCASLRHGEYVT